MNCGKTSAELRSSRSYVLPIALSALALLQPGQVYGCGGWTDIGCNVGKAVEKAAQDTGKAVEKGAQDAGKAVEKAAQDTGNAVEKAAQDTGKAIEKGAQDTGKAVEKAAQDTGKAVEKAAQDTGKAVEKGAHDTGHALEKAGQDIGHFFKEVVNFKLSCDLPGKKPAELAISYRPRCGDQFSTYKNDIDVCNHAGGVSILAAATAGAALNPTPAGAATFALAKIAFELCQKACRSQETVNSCIAEVDEAAKTGANRAADAATQNDQEAEKQALFACVDDAYSGEKLLAMDKLLAECRANSKCNTEDREFAERFEKETAANNALIDDRRTKALAEIKTGKNKGLEYGPTIGSDLVKAISLTPGDKDPTRVCHVRQPNVTARLLVGPGAPETIKVLWVQGGKIIKESPVSVNESDGVATTSADLANQPQGPWKVEFQTPEGKELGYFGFLYRPESP